MYTELLPFTYFGFLFILIIVLLESYDHLSLNLYMCNQQMAFLILCLNKNSHNFVFGLNLLALVPDLAETLPLPSY